MHSLERAANNNLRVDLIITKKEGIHHVETGFNNLG
jgi:hypothetical protein